MCSQFESLADEADEDRMMVSDTHFSPKEWFDDLVIQDVEMSSSSREPLPTLTTVNFDVQRHIMNFLQTEDLSALTRTCRIFSDIGLQPLCMRSGEALRTPKQLLSLLEFLRLGTQDSRAPLIKDLHFCLEEHRVPQDKASYFELHVREPAYFSASNNPLYEEHLLRASRNHALEAFLVVLQHCCELRRLRIPRLTAR